MNETGGKISGATQATQDREMRLDGGHRDVGDGSPDGVRPALRVGGVEGEQFLMSSDLPAHIGTVEARAGRRRREPLEQLRLIRTQGNAAWPSAEGGREGGLLVDLELGELLDACIGCPFE